MDHPDHREVARTCSSRVSHSLAGVCAGASQAQGGYERESFFQPLAGGDFGLDEEELREPASLNGH